MTILICKIGFLLLIRKVLKSNYADLDDLGRWGVSIASVGRDVMPTEKR